MLSDDQFAALMGLLGVAIGWGLNTLTEWVRRRWARQDLSIERGEELLECCQHLFQWQDEARRAAFEGNVYVPIQHPLFRAAAITELYYPDLGTAIREVDSIAKRYRAALVDVAANKVRGLPMSRELNDALAREHDALVPAIGRLLTVARGAVGIKLR